MFLPLFLETGSINKFMNFIRYKKEIYELVKKRSEEADNTSEVINILLRHGWQVHLFIHCSG